MNRQMQNVIMNRGTKLCRMKMSMRLIRNIAMTDVVLMANARHAPCGYTA